MSENKELTNKEKKCIKHFCTLSDTDDNKVIAYIKSGKSGNLEKIIKFFEREDVKKYITKTRKKQQRIDHAVTDYYSDKTQTKKTLLTEENIQLIESCLSQSMSMNSTASLLNISTGTLYNWLRKGHDDIENEMYDTPYAYVVSRIEKARAKGELSLLKLITDTSFGNGYDEIKTDETDLPDGNTIKKTVKIKRKNWRAAAWLLEKTRPTQYGSNNQVIPDDEDDTSNKNNDELLIHNALKMLTSTTTEDIINKENTDEIYYEE